MAEIETVRKVQLSTNFTRFMKYFPIIVGTLMAAVEVAGGESEFAIVPIHLFLWVLE